MLNVFDQISRKEIVVTVNSFFLAKFQGLLLSVLNKDMKQRTIAKNSTLFFLMRNDYFKTISLISGLLVFL